MYTFALKVRWCPDVPIDDAIALEYYSSVLPVFKNHTFMLNRYIYLRKQIKTITLYNCEQ